LLEKSGLRTGVSTILVAIMLFAAGWAETYLPGRSAELTDALMALLIGIIIAVEKTPTEGSRQGTA
jgi:VanZ family protein